jgi:hypothetical protein
MKVKPNKRNPLKVAEGVASTLELALNAVKEAELLRLHPKAVINSQHEYRASLRSAAAKVQDELEWQHARLNKILK